MKKMKITDKNLEKLDLLFKKRWINFDNQKLIEQGNKLLNLMKIIYSNKKNNE